MHVQLHTGTWPTVKAGEKIEVQLPEGPRIFNQMQLFVKAGNTDNACRDEVFERRQWFQWQQLKQQLSWLFSFTSFIFGSVYISYCCSFSWLPRCSFSDVPYVFQSLFGEFDVGNGRSRSINCIAAGGIRIPMYATLFERIEDLHAAEELQVHMPERKGHQHFPSGSLSTML